MQAFSLRTLDRAVIAACLGLGAFGAAQGQVIPNVPRAPLPAASAASGPQAQLPPPNTYVVPSVAVLATQTSNANYGVSSHSRSDTVLQVMPNIFLGSSHARWQVLGDFSLDGTYYVNGVRPNVVAPYGSGSLHSELVDQFVYFDASVVSQQQSISPYVGQGGPVQGSTYTSTQWRISPYIDRLLTPSLRLRARSDDTWTRISNSPSGGMLSGGRYLDQTIRLDQLPQNWGYTLAAQQTYATYDGEPYAWLRDTTFRAILNYALSTQWVVGAIGGHEKVQAQGADDSAGIYGLRTAWSPSPLQTVDATVEHRYFGTGWSLLANVGSPQLSLSASWTRQPTSYLAPLGGNNAGRTAGNISTLLNNLLTTQYTNPVQRAAAVQTLLGSAGLPASLTTAGGFYTTSSVLQNDLVITGLWMRPRDSVAVSVYRNRIEDLFLPGQQLLRLLQSVSNDNVQTGVAINYGHRLTPLDNMNLTLQRENDIGFGLRQGQSAHQTAVILQLDHRFSPRTTGLVGVRRRFLVSTQVGNGNETGVFAGLVHRF